MDRQVEQQAKPSPLIILAATISAGLAQKIANAAKQHAENAEGGEFVFADSVNQHADEGAADERADIHYAADKAHHHRQLAPSDSEKPVIIGVISIGLAM